MEDVVIIGGGLSGAALLYACQRHGRTAVMVEDKVVGGGGATAHSRGMVRVYDPQPQLAEFASAGLSFWREFAADHPEVYAPIGLAYFLRPENVEQARETVLRADNRQHHMELVPAEAIAERCSTLNPDFARAGRTAIWEPHAGHIDPRAAARALADRAKSMGASIIEGVKIHRIVEKSEYIRVETTFGGLNARRVILATGAATQMLRCGHEIKTRSIVLTSFTANENRQPKICLIDEGAGCYLRPGDPGHFYVGGASPHICNDPQDLDVDEEKSFQQNNLFRQTLLETDDYEPLAIHVGHDGYTNDFLPFIRMPDDGVPGAFCGFSGRGAKYIPSLADSLVKEWIERGTL